MIYRVVYGSYTLHTEWVLGTYSNLEEAMRHFDRLSAIRHADEYVSVSTHPDQEQP